MILRFLRCFAAFREMESDLMEARAEVASARERADYATNELHRTREQFEEANKGHIEALKMLTNVSVQVHMGTMPPHPDVWHLPQRKPKQMEYEPIETGRINPADVMTTAKKSFVTDIEEYFQQAR